MVGLLCLTSCSGLGGQLTLQFFSLFECIVLRRHPMRRLLYAGNMRITQLPGLLEAASASRGRFAPRRA